MQTAYWQEIENIFFKAVTLPADEQLKFVKECSGENEELFCEICLLIEKDNQPDCFLDKPLFKTGAKILADAGKERFNGKNSKNIDAMGKEESIFFKTNG